MEPMANNAYTTIYEDLDYNLEYEVKDAVANDDIVATNVVNRGTTRLYNFHNQHGKRVKIHIIIEDIGYHVQIDQCLLVF